MSITLALPSWCSKCERITGTSKEKKGKGQGVAYYCKRCGDPK